MTDAGPEHTSDTGPRSRSKSRERKAEAMTRVSPSPTGIGRHGTALNAMHTPPPSWSVAAMSRCFVTRRSSAISARVSAAVDTFWFRFTINRPPYWCCVQSVSTAPVSAPRKPTIITAPTSSSSVMPAAGAGDTEGEGEDTAGAGDEPAVRPELHATDNATTTATAQCFTSFLTAGACGRFSRLPSWLELGDRGVDRVDELLNIVLAHRRRKRAHQPRRHQHPMVEKAQEQVARLLLVGGDDAAVVDDGLVGEVQREHRAGPVHLHRDAVRGKHLGQLLAYARALAVQLFVHVGRELPHSREPSGHAERVAVVGPTLGEAALMARVEHVHHIRAAAKSSDRQAATDDLAQRGHVRLNAVELLGAAGRDPEGDDLVEDQQDAEFPGHVAEAAEKLGRRGDHAAGADDGLEDHGGETRGLAADDPLGGVRVVEREHDNLLERPARRADRVGRGGGRIRWSGLG